MTEDVVRDVLQAVHFNATFLDQPRILDRPYAVDGFLDLDDAELDQLRKFDHRGVGLGDAVAVHLLHGAVDVVEDIVQRRCKAGYLFRLERRDERPVQLLVDLVRNVVALVLELLHPVALFFDVLKVLDELDEQIGCGDDRSGHPVKEIKKSLVLRDHPLFNAHNDRYKVFLSGAIYGSVRVILSGREDSVKRGRFGVPAPGRARRALPGIAPPRPVAARNRYRALPPAVLTQRPSRGYS